VPNEGSRVVGVLSPRPASIAVIVPILNERKALPKLLAALLRTGADEVILVDGGSTDGSVEWLTQELNEDIKLLSASPGRAQQMNKGAQVAKSDILLFLHADTSLPSGALDEVVKASWGRFDLEFFDNQSPKSKTLDLVAWMINLRSRFTGVATGDQAIFIRRDLFEQIGGFDAFPLMEDVAISKKLRIIAAPYCSKLKVRTSARRWKKNGIWKTIVLMWGMRLAFFMGVDPDRLNQFYAQVR